jgi:ribose transport system ATP-binding protein
MIPEDRKSQALQLEAPMYENITFNSLKRLKSLVWINRAKQLKLSRERGERFNIQPNQPLKIVQELSGGTQQKVVLANWLFEGFEILIMDEPTRGIDVGAKAEVFRIIRSWADQSVGIILISSEFSELIGMCDRILVVRDGRQVGILDGRTADEKTILQLIFMGENETRSLSMD